MKCVDEVEEAGRLMFLYREKHDVVYGHKMSPQKLVVCRHA